jgi:hypothetical protein
MTVTPAPIYEPVVSQDGIATIPWISFFNSVFEGDSGEVWSPEFTNLTAVGTPTITGSYYRIGQFLTYFRITINPATSTTSTAGTTYVGNFPLTLAGDGACLAVSGLLGGSSGMVDRASNRIYVPAWSAVTVPLSIVGIAETA